MSCTSIHLRFTLYIHTQIQIWRSVWNSHHDDSTQSYCSSTTISIHLYIYTLYIYTSSIQWRPSIQLRFTLYIHTHKFKSEEVCMELITTTQHNHHTTVQQQNNMKSSSKHDESSEVTLPTKSRSDLVSNVVAGTTFVSLWISATVCYDVFKCTYA